MKRLDNLWRVVANDLATRCCTSAIRDAKTVTDRFEHEGLPFLAITLPAFGKDFERSLESGKVVPSSFQGFHRGKKGLLPLFLGGFLEQVFDSETGVLLDDPSIDCIFSIRQLCHMFGKILRPCSDARKRGAIRKFIECESEVKQGMIRLAKAPELREEFRRVSFLLFQEVFNGLCQEILDHRLTGRHGPGVTADRLLGNKKYELREWTERLESIFPFGEYAMPNWRFAYQYDSVDFREPENERPVKVILVPKTLKTPRVIAAEPTCMQFMQQAISQRLVDLLESEKLSTRESFQFRGMIGFRDQMPNRQMAKLGSIDGKLATLDLAEASDRVSVVHVADLFHSWPLLQEAVMATRSTKAQVPGYGVIPLTKFASMGSALCFPIEAMVFTTVIWIGISNALRTPVTRKLIREYASSVRVYGDDLIVPVDCVRHVIDALELYGFKVNVNKSFWNGKFRESCGGDFYDGVDVTPVRIRRDLPPSRAGATRDSLIKSNWSERVVSLVSARNQLYYAGCWSSARWMDTQIEKVISHFPTVLPTSPVLGRHSFLSGYQVDRFDHALHRPLTRGYVVHSRPPISRLDGEGALLKFLLKSGQEPFDEEHLERQGRPSVVDIKLRWKTPY